jgi:hypothetical protein
VFDQNFIQFSSFHPTFSLKLARPVLLFNGESKDELCMAQISLKFKKQA